MGVMVGEASADIAGTRREDAHEGALLVCSFASLVALVSMFLFLRSHLIHCCVFVFVSAERGEVDYE